MTSRLETLQQFFQDDPNDPFNLYALALEWQRTDPHQSLYFFQELISRHPEYIPTYYQLGKFYQELNERDKAQKIFKQGIEYAKQKNEMKALRELQTAFQELEFE